MERGLLLWFPCKEGILTHRLDAVPPRGGWHSSVPRRCSLTTDALRATANFSTLATAHSPSCPLCSLTSVVSL